MTTKKPDSRRSFLKQFGTIGMVTGLVAGYGSFFTMLFRYLFPYRAAKKNWLYVAPLAEINTGGSLSYTLPSGESVLISRSSETESLESFLALSSICPHLGCKVSYEPQNNRLFCPCHNGVFSLQGKATEGPPAASNQNLSSFKLKIKKGLLYIDAGHTGLHISKSSLNINKSTGRVCEIGTRDRSKRDLLSNSLHNNQSIDS